MPSSKLSSTLAPLTTTTTSVPPTTTQSTPDLDVSNMSRVTTTDKELLNEVSETTNVGYSKFPSTSKDAGDAER